MRLNTSAELQVNMDSENLTHYDIEVTNKNTKYK